MSQATDSPEAVSLIEALAAELRERYPETAFVHGFDPQDHASPRLIFLVVPIGRLSNTPGLVVGFEDLSWWQ